MNNNNDVYVVYSLVLQFHICSLSLDATIEQCDSLHERWQHHQKQYFSSSLADLEHRILLAEDSLKKHKSQPHLAEVEQSYAHRNLRCVVTTI